MANPNIKLPKRLPLVLLSGVLLPGASIQLQAKTENQENLVKLLLNQDSNAFIGVIPKEGHDTDDSSLVHSIGTAASVEKITKKNPSQQYRVLYLKGVCRFRVEEVFEVSSCLWCHFHQLEKLPGMDKETNEDSEELIEMMRLFRDQARRLVTLLDPDNFPVAHLKKSLATLPTEDLPDIFAAVINISYEERLQVLEAVDVTARFNVALPLLLREVRNLIIQKVLKGAHRNPQGVSKRSLVPGQVIVGGFSKLFPMKTTDSDISSLEKKLKGMNLPDYARKVFLKDIENLKKMPRSGSDHSVLRGYLELVVDLPWAKETVDILDVKQSRAQLDADHYGMTKLKKRVLEYLAVRQLKNSMKGPILCFVGPPGVGKTSIGRSIARSLGRKFHRVSLGGVSNQAEIRGHRRTYIGAMPGRIIQGLRTAGVKNPVFLLDEVDKMTIGARGNPAAALLEVLDPEQNNSFTDHYVNVPFDLSQVLFIGTANTVTQIPPALLDRMEVISIPGYTHEEKEHIAINHLVPKQIMEHGLTPQVLEITPEAVRTIIHKYTKEAGVRSLERKIGALCRAVALKVTEEKMTLPTPHEALVSDTTIKPTSEISLVPVNNVAHPPVLLPFVLDEKAVLDILGMPIYDTEVRVRFGHPGVAVGLAWSVTGGSIMIVEATKVSGDGQLILTGKLGKVMKESAKLALNWVRSHAKEYGIAVQNGTDIVDNINVHIHFPSGAISKEGPSAGVVIIVALVSLFTGRLVQPDVAITGEVTLHGLVLPVGRVKEKILAAHRDGMRSCILPYQNEKDLVDIPKSIRNDMTFHLCKHVDDVLQAAFKGGFPTTSNKVNHIVSKL